MFLSQTLFRPKKLQHFCKQNFMCELFSCIYAFHNIITMGKFSWGVEFSCFSKDCHLATLFCPHWVSYSNFAKAALEMKRMVHWLKPSMTSCVKVLPHW